MLQKLQPLSWPNECNIIIFIISIKVVLGSNWINPSCNVKFEGSLSYYQVSIWTRTGVCVCACVLSCAIFLTIWNRIDFNFNKCRTRLFSTVSMMVSASWLTLTFIHHCNEPSTTRRAMKCLHHSEILEILFLLQKKRPGQRNVCKLIRKYCSSLSLLCILDWPQFLSGWRISKSHYVGFHSGYNYYN